MLMGGLTACFEAFTDCECFTQTVAWIHSFIGFVADIFDKCSLSKAPALVNFPLIH